MTHAFRNSWWTSTAILAVVLMFGQTGAAQQQDQDENRASPSTAGRQTILVGELVDLHKHMTGSKDKSTKQDPIDRLRNRDDDKDDDKDDAQKQPRRPGARQDDPARPGVGGAQADKQKHKDSQRIYALKTARGIVIVNFKEQPGVLATPRTDREDTLKDRQDDPTKRDDLRNPNRTPGQDQPGQRNRIDAQDSDKQSPDECLNKQVRVDGMLYEKDGTRYMVAKSIKKTEAGSDLVPPVRRPQEDR